MATTKTLSVETTENALQAYRALVVHAEPELSGSNHVEVAGRLAREAGALLIGVGAQALDATFASEPYNGFVLGEWVKAAEEQLETDLRSAETAFRRDAAGADLEWRVMRTFPDRALVEAARASDLIVMSSVRDGASPYRRPHPGEVVLKAGCPVLVVPPSARHLRARCVVVAWKDSREARRAVRDALPFLKQAEDVLVHTVARKEDLEAAAFQTNDVAAALRRHGVQARPNVAIGHDETAAGEIERVALGHGADLIVAGGYGHSRLGEWLFGGVTHELVHRPSRFVLLSH